MNPATRWTTRFERASEVLASVHDIVVTRPFDETAPAWCESRGWHGYLETLDPSAIDLAEREGVGAWVERDPNAPRDLVDLVARVRGACELPTRGPPSARSRRGRENVSDRKREQVAAFVAAVRGLSARPRRVIDVGSGHGHLTRDLAAALGVAAVGWEIDPTLLARARTLARGSAASFVRRDVRRDGLDLDTADLVVGLHCCGDLGDRAMTAARDASAAIAIVGCCPQKREGDRAPLRAPTHVPRVTTILPHAALGLANRHAADSGIEEDLATRTRSRVLRLALHDLLTASGVVVSPGEEMRGVNRRHATHDLESLVLKAFAVRGIPAPDASAMRDAERVAWHRYERMRRWSLVRDLLARLVEVTIALDRAAYLEEAGYVCEVVTLFEATVSPRNIAVTGVRS